MIWALRLLRVSLVPRSPWAGMSVAFGAEIVSKLNPFWIQFKKDEAKEIRNPKKRFAPAGKRTH
jgi:hypothetical protein